MTPVPIQPTRVLPGSALGNAIVVSSGVICARSSLVFLVPRLCLGTHAWEAELPGQAELSGAAAKLRFAAYVPRESLGTRSGRLHGKFWSQPAVIVPAEKPPANHK